MITSSGTDLNNFTVRFIVPIVGSLGAAMATVWLLQEVNPLGAFCLLAAIGMFLVAVVSPRRGTVLLLLLCGYSDFIKRLLLIFGDLDFNQISYVLAIAPGVVIGLVLSLFTQRAFHRITVQKSDLVLGGVAAGLTALNFLIAKTSGSNLLDAAKVAVNTGIFSFASVAGLRCFRDEQDVEKFLRTVLFLFVPVAIYGLYQLKFGFADFEIDYLRSGFSIEIKQLFDVRPRPFSTLNSAGVFGTLSGGLSVISLYPWLARSRRVMRKGEATGSILLFLLFLSAAVGSLIRSSHIVWIGALIAFWCFRSRRRTILFYVLAVTSFITLVLSADFIEGHMADIDPAQFTTTDYGATVLSIGTYNDRLNGFIRMTSSWDIWSVFGLPKEVMEFEAQASHDPLSTILIKTGVVGVLSSISAVAASLTWLHRKLLNMPKGSAQLLATLLTSVLMGWLAAEVLVKWVITVFPLNALFWLLVGIVAFLVRSQEADDKEPGDAGELSSDRTPFAERLRATALHGAAPANRFPPQRISTRHGQG